MKTSYFRAVVAIVATLGTAPVAAITVSPPPAREYVAQVWVGFSVDDNYSLRLDLKKDGTGAGSVLSGGESRNIRITSWVQEGDELKIAFNFVDKDKTRGRLVGHFKTYLLSWNSNSLPHPERVHDGKLPGPLELTIEGSGTRFGLWPEKELLELLRQLKSARQP